MRVAPKYLAPALVAAAATAITLAGCAPTTAAGGGDGDAADAAPVAIGMITSQTGPLAAYGEAYTAGFEAGLDYATEGSGEVEVR
jgi:branched-chain amino acid transport system substrate-binding protein